MREHPNVSIRRRIAFAVAIGCSARVTPALARQEDARYVDPRAGTRRPLFDAAKVAAALSARADTSIESGYRMIAQ